MTIAEALKLGADALSREAISSPERESSLLLRHVLNRDAAFMYAHPDHRLNAMESILFKAVIKRRASHEPYQYIVGKQEFFGLEFEVNPNVLIPRPETEVLVENAIEEFRDRDSFRICEVGVGSGCISVSLLISLPHASAIGADISEVALEVAERNAVRHRVLERLELIKSDVFENVGATPFDLIVSNPPYVPTRDLESLQNEVKDHEPGSALFGGEDGLDVVRRVVTEAPKYMKPKGFILMEIGWDQSDPVNDLFDPSLWSEVRFLSDLQGIPRIVKAQIK